MKLVAFLLMLIALGTRVAWDSPSLLICLTFWATLILSLALYANYLVLPGAICNAAAMLANGGAMPVYGYEIVPHGVHVPGETHHQLQILCDRFWGFSIGDFLLFGGIAVLVIFRISYSRAANTVGHHSSANG